MREDHDVRDKAGMNPGVAKTVARLRRARVRASAANKSTPAQIMKTVLICLFWMGVAPMYVHLIATFKGYLSAQYMVQSLAVFGGVAVHLWPTATPPWRTIFWAMIAMMLTGIVALSAGAGDISLTLVTIVGFAIVVGRVNSNARRVWGLIRTHRELP